VVAAGVVWNMAAPPFARVIATSAGSRDVLLSINASVRDNCILKNERILARDPSPQLLRKQV
jgi:hypothetical protein